MKQQFSNKNIDFYLSGWSKIPLIKGNSFDDIFHIEGVSLWWIWKKYFSKYLMPRQINTYSFMNKGIDIPLWLKIRYSVNALAMKKFISYNEKKKINFFREKKSFSGGKKVLFLTYSNHIQEDNTIFRIQNIVDTLQKDKKIEPLIIFIDPISSQNYKSLKNKNNIYQYFDKKIDKKAHFLANKLSKKWKKIPAKIKKELFKKDTNSLWKYLQYHFNLYFSKDLLYLTVLQYELMKKIISSENITTCVVTAQHNLFEKSLLAAAENAGVPSILIQHGLNMGGDNLDIPPSTRCAIFGEQTKKELFDVGIKEGNIHTTGAVIFDELINYKKNNVKSNKVKIVLATVNAVEDGSLSKKKYWNYIKKITNDLIKIENIELVIKMHPAEINLIDYQNFTRNMDNVKVLKGQDRNGFYTALSECDVFLHFDSTSALEAMILSKPVINIKILGKEIVSFTDRASIIVSPLENIHNKVIEVLNDDSLNKTREELLQNICGHVDGKAHQRIASLIYQLTDSNSVANI